eukprot:scaffold707_cov399-Prasinococcus_capsulatus_cf.AAC.1
MAVNCAHVNRPDVHRLSIRLGHGILHSPSPNRSARKSTSVRDRHFIKETRSIRKRMAYVKKD